MKAYGKPRKACANRKIKGTSIDCPCCTPRGSNSDEATKAYKAKERSLKLNVEEIDTECVDCFLEAPDFKETMWMVVDKKCFDCEKVLNYASGGVRRSAFIGETNV